MPYWNLRAYNIRQNWISAVCRELQTGNMTKNTQNTRLFYSINQTAMSLSKQTVQGWLNWEILWQQSVNWLEWLYAYTTTTVLSKAWMRPFHDDTFYTSRCCFTLFIVWTPKLVKSSTIARFILFNIDVKTQMEGHQKEEEASWTRLIKYHCYRFFMLKCQICVGVLAQI